MLLDTGADGQHKIGLKLNDSEPYPSLNPPYIRLFKWERNFDFHKWKNLMSEYWFVCVTIIVIYISMIFRVRSWMKNREPVKLRGFLIFWNVTLAIFSTFAFRRNIPEIFHLVFRTPNGFHDTVCSRNHFSMGTALWELIGIFSKVIELGDTAFIVLRKQPLILLHWYHHATVLMYTWYTYEAFDPSHRLFMTMNYFVHIFLYFYYATKAIGYNVSRKIAMVVTCIQLIQMIVGVFANVYTLWIIENGGDCDREKRNIHLALGMYGSYLVLFSHFFYNSYIARKKAKTS